LKSKIHILQERTKNTGVIFHCIAFSVEAEIILWYFNKNPSGRGLAAVVDIISIGNFQFLTRIMMSMSSHVKNIGYRLNANTKYLHTTLVQYPASFAG
jgi:hypothetical protein